MLQVLTTIKVYFILFVDIKVYFNYILFVDIEAYCFSLQILIIDRVCPRETSNYFSKLWFKLQSAETRFKVPIVVVYNFKIEVPIIVVYNFKLNQFQSILFMLTSFFSRPTPFQFH